MGKGTMEVSLARGLKESKLCCRSERLEERLGRVSKDVLEEITDVTLAWLKCGMGKVDWIEGS